MTRNQPNSCFALLQRSSEHRYIDIDMLMQRVAERRNREVWKSKCTRNECYVIHERFAFRGVS